MEGYSGYWGGERLITDIAFARPKPKFLNISVSVVVVQSRFSWLAIKFDRLILILSNLRPSLLNLQNASPTKQLTVIGRGGQNVVIFRWEADRLLD